MSNEIKFDADILLESVNAHGADGHVYNDTKKRFFNGAQIHTSPVVNIDTYLLMAIYKQLIQFTELLFRGVHMSIKPELVERDENGYWAHSQIPVSEDVEYLKQWFDNNCLEICNVYMDGDIDENHPTFKLYFEDGQCDISGWVPSKPQGEGWFIGGISESEDGPVCSWLRPDVAKLKAKFLKAHKEAEKAAFEYFCACDVGDERIQASEVYERIRTSTRIGG